MAMGLAGSEIKNECVGEASSDLSETRRFFPEFGVYI
jgi:hypothetical protein